MPDARAAPAQAVQSGVVAHRGGDEDALDSLRLHALDRRQRRAVAPLVRAAALKPD